METEDLVYGRAIAAFWWSVFERVGIVGRYSAQNPTRCGEDMGEYNRVERMVVANNDASSAA